MSNYEADPTSKLSLKDIERELKDSPGEVAREIIALIKADLFERVNVWRLDFEQKAQSGFNGTGQYYGDAASGLAIALQEIDRERYDAETKR